MIEQYVLDMIGRAYFTGDFERGRYLMRQWARLVIGQPIYRETHNNRRIGMRRWMKG